MIKVVKRFSKDQNFVPGGSFMLHILFYIYIIEHYCGIVDILHKKHASSAFVCKYICTDCQHVEIFQTKSLTRFSD